MKGGVVMDFTILLIDFAKRRNDIDAIMDELERWVKTDGFNMDEFGNLTDKQNETYSYILDKVGKLAKEKLILQHLEKKIKELN